MMTFSLKEIFVLLGCSKLSFAIPSSIQYRLLAKGNTLSGEGFIQRTDKKSSKYKYLDGDECQGRKRRVGTSRYCCSSKGIQIELVLGPLDLVEHDFHLVGSGNTGSTVIWIQNKEG